MTCTGCLAKVQSLLSGVENITKLDIDLPNGTAAISMSKHVATSELQAALAAYPKYQLSELPHQHHAISSMLDDAEEAKSFLTTYKPVLLIFGYVGLLSLLIASLSGTFNGMLAMRVFMSGFFLVFSFFKMLDLNGFADSYSTYDIVAKKFRAWGFVYAFIELALGIAFALNFMPVVTNAITFAVMSISLIGVLQSVLNKRKIRCACLGAVFNLPMSTVTIIEDALMIAMSGVMLGLIV
ncbi:heavy metal transporter [Mucilaginibacter pedocola]|uniref:Heavy metal transporter n=2 Tax=Mucilaginibacter pedocola TaxID=1792845 RepID=A0A1S9PMX4_9SPHI|nr:heavy metal transporter [Mucilaginibacter pedocola]